MGAGADDIAAAPGAHVAPGGRALILRSGANLAALLIFVALALVPLLADALDDPFLVVTLTRVMIFAIAVLSLDFILGYGAMVSFGHAAFMGLGAYSVAIPAAHGINDIFVQAAIAIVVCGLFALVTGAISLRTRGVYFIMITLAFGQMAYFFMTSLSAYGGDDGITLADRSGVLGSDVLENNVVFYYVVLAVVIAVYAALTAIIGARFGRVLRGTRDNSLRMQAIGFPPFRFQLTAYVIAGAIAGIAGVFLANQTEFVSPAYMSWQRSGELIVMVVLGGMGSLVGALPGTLAFLLMEEWLAYISQHWKLGLGIILVLIVLFTRGGITGFVSKYLGGARS
ncbi:branched-chain amino acid ABC transporter permease [Microbaculum marinum]|uniref:Branched-chain amino acid ABC transporter permease n=1 Tax=Microbaculum marinum TaxID=1764581 RepID=A0AAW9S155_9HYPH